MKTNKILLLFGIFVLYYTSAIYCEENVGASRGETFRGDPEQRRQSVLSRQPYVIQSVQSAIRPVISTFVSSQQSSFSSNPNTPYLPYHASQPVSEYYNPPSYPQNTQSQIISNRFTPDSPQTPYSDYPSPNNQPNQYSQTQTQIQSYNSQRPQNSYSVQSSSQLYQTPQNTAQQNYNNEPIPQNPSYSPSYNQNSQSSQSQSSQNSKIPSQNYPQSTYIQSSNPNPNSQYPSQQNYQTQQIHQTNVQKPSQHDNVPYAQKQPSYSPQRPNTPQYYNPTQGTNTQNNGNTLNSRFDTNLDGQFASSPRPNNLSTRRPATPEPTPPVSKNPTIKYDSELADSMEKFSLQIFAALVNSNENENIMISPFSIHSLLLLLAEAAEGDSLDQIFRVLELKNVTRTRSFDQYLNEALKKSSADVTISKFSALVRDGNRPIDTDYEDLIQKSYDAEVFSADFTSPDRSAKVVNDYVNSKTNGLIPEAVTRDDLLKAQLVLLSGVYFQGRWKHIFNESFTKIEPFFDNAGSNQTGKVNMMFQRGPFGYAAVQRLGSHVLELPYAINYAQTDNDGVTSDGDRLSMILVLPRKGLSLIDALDSVHQYGMKNLYKEIRMSKVEYEDEEVEVHLPRFTTETSLDLIDYLKALGITDVFDQTRAMLLKLNRSNKYYVSSMLHKSKIQVTEEGTQAAAVTTSIFANKATPPKFHANRPFLYFIVDKATKTILFSGQYASPQAF